MMLVQLCTMVILAHITCGLISNGFEPCEKTPSSYVGPPLPTLPDQFQTHIEAHFVQKNQTRNIVEYYDYIGNRSVIVDYNRTTKALQKTVLNFNDQEARIIYEDNMCKIMKTNSSWFSFITTDGKHMRSVKDLLYFSEDMGEVFISGDEKVRGINVNHWRACVKIPSINGTFNVDYYFSKGSGYSIDGYEVQVPLRAVVNGTGNSRDSNGSISDDYHSFYHIYDFFDFKPRVLHDPKVFEVPVGVICNKGDVPKDKPTPEISHQFAAGMEKVVMHDGTETERQTIQLYLDFSAKVFRLDVDRPLRRDQNLYGGRPLTYIQDYNTDLMYVIDRLEQNCTVSTLKHPMHREPPPPTVMVDFFQNFSSFIYQGQKTWRGLPVESWGFYNQSSKTVTEIFFHTPQPSPQGRLDPHQLDNMIPVGIYKNGIGFMPHMQNEEQTTYEHLFGFSSGHPDPEVFDISMCYAKDHHSTYLALDVTGRNVDEILRFHQKEFLSEVRQTISGAAGVSATRIASLKWEEARSSGTSTTLIVTFQLLDNKLYGMDSTVGTGPSLADAISNLQKSVNSGTSLVFDVKLSTSHSVRFSILAGSLWEVYTDKSENQTSSSIKKYGAGSMAGLAIGMLVIGALLGLVAAFIIYKRIDTSVPYQVSQ